jgi:tetratricopeptide (TPR) repeat protein
MSDHAARPQWSRGVLALLLGLLLAAGAGLAQDQDATPREQAVNAARSAMQDAIAAGEAPYPDRPNWSEAISHARRAVELAPSDREALGLLAEVYSRTNFYGPAWRTWDRYLDQGYDLTPDWTPLFAEAGEQMAYAAYQRGDLQEAARVHLDVLDVVPFHRASRVWMGRIRMEQGRPADAIPYWEAAAEQDPDDDRASYFLRLVQDQAEWGVEAVNAFREGVRRYENGDLDGAARSFERATDANAAYAEAWAWRGRVAFERESWRVAQRHYARALELAPDNDTYRYFRNEAERRAG